jgi:hypothetical protein
MMDSTVALICDAHRRSTARVYDRQWRAWVRWCRVNDVDPSKPSEADLANHLAYLAVDLSLSASTVRVRRSAIASTLAQMGVRGVGGSAWVADVIRGVSQREARVPRRVPAWDLGVVLSFLQGSRFEPLSSAPLARVCVKTAFLVLLASGRRSSEVTALSGLDSDVALEADGSMSLRFLPEFQAKNQRPGDRSPVILIKPLAWILASNDPDLVNCPVRCLQVYRRRSRRLRALSQRQLFLSLNVDYRRDIRPTTISRWVATLIRDAYKALGETEGGGRPALGSRCRIQGSMKQGPGRPP